MGAAGEVQMVTSQEFVTDLLCELALHDMTIIKLSDTFADARFEQAYRELVSEQAKLNISVDFSLAVNPYHGDSSTLRETLYALRERGIVAINNPKFKTVEVQVDGEDAEYYLGRSAIPRNFLRDMVEKYFTSKDAAVDERQDRKPAAVAA